MILTHERREEDPIRVQSKVPLRFRLFKSEFCFQREKMKMKRTDRGVRTEASLGSL